MENSDFHCVLLFNWADIWEATTDLEQYVTSHDKQSFKTHNKYEHMTSSAQYNIHIGWSFLSTWALNTIVHNQYHHQEKASNCLAGSN